MGSTSDFDYATIKYPGVSVEEGPALARSLVAPTLVISPNPFRDRVTITLNGADQRIGRSVSRASGYQQSGLSIYDACGRLVRSFALCSMPSAHSSSPHTLGSVLISWDGRDDRGANLPAGVYFIRSEDAGIKPVRIVKIR
jgi:hypothetical protein